MSTLAFCILIVTAAMLLFLRRQWCPLPLFLGATYVSLGQFLDVFGFDFSVIRVLIVVGFLRVICKHERLTGGFNRVDGCMLLWAVWLIVSCVFHRPTVFAGHAGEALNQLGLYLLFRVFVRNLADVILGFKFICAILVPVACTMLTEKLTGYNPLSVLGLSGSDVTYTVDHFRATGAFGHPILAGTVGATSLPMAIYLRKEAPRLAWFGGIAAIAIVYSSGSSGPILTLLGVLVALAFWVTRQRMRILRWLGVLAILGLDLIMNDPVYYLMARIDLTGGSTGYFRARLLESAFEHWGEWWLVGTDFTRHWMASGIGANEEHTDMTNFYLQMGVWAGITLVVLFIGVLTSAYSRIGRALRQNRVHGKRTVFLIWVLGSILFGHMLTFMSVSYFDQTIVFFYWVLGSVGSLRIWEANSGARRGMVGSRREVPCTN